jgi:thymidylate synthase
MIAFLTQLEPFELTHCIGDAHIYLNHEEALQEQIKRIPFDFPKLTILDRGQTTIDDFQADDFVFTDYKHHGKLPMKMAV